MSQQSTDSVQNELKRLVDGFFDAVSFEAGGTPSYKRIHGLFIETGLLIKNSGANPEISTVRQFIEPRQASVDCGDLILLCHKSSFALNLPQQGHWPRRAISA